MMFPGARRCFFTLGLAGFLTACGDGSTGESGSGGATNAGGASGTSGGSSTGGATKWGHRRRDRSNRGMSGPEVDLA